jgi:hypothetical protein
MSVIPARHKAEVGGLKHEIGPEQKHLMRLYLKNKLMQKINKWLKW